MASTVCLKAEKESITRADLFKTLIELYAATPPLKRNKKIEGYQNALKDVSDHYCLSMGDVG